MTLSSRSQDSWGGDKRDAVGPPLVAIVTPVFNGQQYLHEAMDCVQQCDYPNLVHVVLDNASTDATPEIIASYKDGRIPLVVARNPTTVPLVCNFNRALSLLPPGVRYFRVLCADDLIDQTAISKMVAVAESDPEITVVGCHCRDVGILGSELPSTQAVFEGRDIVGRYLRRETMAFSGTHLLFRTQYMVSNVPVLDASFPSTSDAEAAVRMALKGRVGFVHETLARFRIHAQSHTATVSAYNGEHYIEWLLLLDRHALSVMPKSEYLQYRRAYRRHYLRRLLLSAARSRDWSIFRHQVHRMTAIGDPVHVSDFADALLDWVRLAATGQREHAGVARRPSTSSIQAID